MTALSSASSCPAAAIRDLVTKPLAPNSSPSDAEAWNELTSPSGPLFSGLDFADLA